MPVVVNVAGVMLSEVPILRPTPRPPPLLLEPACVEMPAPPIGSARPDVVNVVVVVAAAVAICVVLTVVSLRFCRESDIITAVGVSPAVLRTEKVTGNVRKEVKT